MRAMVLKAQGRPLELMDIPRPQPGPGQVLVKVSCCGVCRTDLHVVDGDLAEPKLPLVPGHQVVGTIESVAYDVSGFTKNQRVGIPWLGGSCGCCEYCTGGRENLCDSAVYTGYQLDGGFAEYCVSDARYCFPIPDGYPDIQAAPLLCAGLIGYRSYRMCGDAARIGLYGFGAAAHIICQVACFEGREVYAYTREGDDSAREFAGTLGATWAGSSAEQPPEPLDAAIISAPAGELVPAALRAVKKGGVVVCAGIHMSDIPSFSYELLWGERVVRSVANLTRRDGLEVLELAPKVPVRTQVHEYSLATANAALDDLRAGRFDGQAVIRI